MNVLCKRPLHFGVIPGRAIHLQNLAKPLCLMKSAIYIYARTSISPIGHNPKERFLDHICIDGKEGVDRNTLNNLLIPPTCFPLLDPYDSMKENVGCEQIFSCLWKFKIYLRNSMAELMPKQH